MGEKLRCFIAIDLEQPIRRLIMEIQEQLSSINRFVRWVKPDNAHITLKFLGDLSLKEIAQVEDCLVSATQHQAPTSFSTTTLNAIPNLRSPRVIYLDIAANPSLDLLSRSVDQGLRGLKLKLEKREFFAHITLARVKSSDGKNLIVQSIEHMAGLPSLTQELNKITLFKSTLTSQGPVYECLFESFLKGPSHG
jgi:RNA 2',3'-cyclic 3'-phosphodiesterase